MIEMKPTPRSSVYISPADVTALAQCGLSPVQLVEQRDELLAMLHGVLQMGRGSSGRIIIEGWQEEVLRAALDKCEGVKP